MHDTAKVITYGTLLAKGTREKPIVFRGDRLDFILNDILPYDRTPSQWGGIFFRPESYHNIMDNVIVRNGKTGLTFEKSSPGESKLKLSNSQITNMGEHLFSRTQLQYRSDQHGIDQCRRRRCRADWRGTTASSIAHWLIS